MDGVIHTKAGIIYENGHSASFFLRQIVKSVSNNGLKVVVISDDEKMSDWTCVVGKPNPKMCAESYKKVTIQVGEHSWKSLCEFLISLANKTTDVQLLVIDRIDRYLSSIEEASMLITLIRNAIDTFGIDIFISLSQNGACHKHMIDTILIPDKVFCINYSMSERLVLVTNLSDKMILKFQTNQENNLKLIDFVEERDDFEISNQSEG